MSTTLSTEDPGDLLIERSDGIAWLTLNRPHKANALTLAMQAGIVGFLERAGADAGIKAVVLTGSGERTFSAGADFSESVPDAEPAEARSRQMFECCIAIAEFEKPLVAAVNGHACGSGFMYALLADACVATAAATFSLPEISRGQPTFAGASLLTRLCGDALARDLVQSGRRMPAAEALQAHLVSAVCPPSELKVRAAEAAAKLSAFAPHAFAANKQWIGRGYRALLEEAAHASIAARAAARNRKEER